ncbi:MAG TPA: hypothetical protein VF276_15735, partial [Chloroflexia bacterium]
MTVSPLAAAPGTTPGRSPARGPAPLVQRLTTPLALLLFLVVAALVTWPQLPHAADSLRDAGDPALFVWTLHWLATAVTHDPAQLYAGPIFHGFPNPVTFTDTSLLPGVLLAPLWLADNHLLFLNLLMWVTLALVGFTAYLLIRRLSGSVLGGIVGGMVCAVNGYTLAHLSHLNLLSAYWLPLGLLALHYLFHPDSRGPRWWVALALAAALIGQTLSTFYVLAYFLIAMVAYVAWQALAIRAVWRWPGAWRWRLVAQLLVVALLVGAVIVAVTAPYWETNRVLGLARSAEEIATWSAQPLDYIGVSLHNHTYARLLPHSDPEPLFAGFTALILAAIGAHGAWRQARRKAPPSAARVLFLDEAGFYAALTLLAALLTLGPSLDVGAWHIPLPYALLAQVPGATALRAPVRAMVLVNLGIAVFAGLGTVRVLAALTGRATGLTPPAPFPAREGGDTGATTESGAADLPSPPRGGAGGEVAARWMRVLIVGALAVMIGVEQQVAPLALTPMPATAAELPPAYRWLTNHPDGGVLIEMPVGLGLRDPTVETTHMYYQTWHGHPLVSGYSGFRPATYTEIFTFIDSQYADFTAEQLGLLQSLDVRYVLYHAANYKTSAWARVQAGLARFPQVREVGHFPSGTYGDDYLYALDPRPASATLQITAMPGATANSLTVHITNPYTYPLLSRLRPTLDLSTPDGRRIAVPTPLLLAPGEHRFAVALPGPSLAPPLALRPVVPFPSSLQGAE